MESELKDGSLPVLLVEGIFTPDDALIVSSINAYPEDAMTSAVCYNLHITSDDSITHTFRMLIPADMKKPQLEQLDEHQNWISLPSEKDGSYLVFTLDEKDAVVCCVDRPATISPIMIVGLVLLLLVLTAVLILYSIRRKK